MRRGHYEGWAMWRSAVLPWAVLSSVMDGPIFLALAIVCVLHMTFASNSGSRIVCLQGLPPNTPAGVCCFSSRSCVSCCQRAGVEFVRLQRLRSKTQRMMLVASSTCNLSSKLVCEMVVTLLKATCRSNCVGIAQNCAWQQGGQ